MSTMRSGGGANPGGAGSPGAGSRGGAGRPDPIDPVFDFTGVGRVDLGALAIMLTAREMMPEENRRVWVAGLPPSFWNSMRSMGLDGYFMQLPSRRGLKA